MVIMMIMRRDCENWIGWDDALMHDKNNDVCMIRIMMMIMIRIMMIMMMMMMIMRMHL